MRRQPIEVSGSFRIAVIVAALIGIYVLNRLEERRA